MLVFLFHALVKKQFAWIGFRQTTAIFLFKVLLACVYGFIFKRYYGGDDTWNFFSDSILEYDKMIHRIPQSLLKK